MPRLVERTTSARKAEAIAAVVGLAAGCTFATGAPAESAPTIRESLGGVACISATACFAVGDSDSVSSHTARTLIERWNGRSWSKIASPNPTGTTASLLFGVSCARATSCFAVGQTGAYGARRRASLVERWDGTTWSIVKAPNVGPLTSASCTSATNCFAAGGAVLGWNGTVWSIVTSPELPVNSVSCASTTSCMAVADTASKRWNGTSWSTVPTPQGDANEFEGLGLNGVSCTSATNCMAVGADSVPLDDFSLLAERWNGTAWSRVPPPLPDMFGYFNGVSCASATSCFAVGSANPNRPRAFVHRWDGRTWSGIASPSFGRGDSWLAAVSCSGPTSCFAVGYLARPYFGDQHALIERWDGNAWTVSSPNGSAT